MSTRRPNIKKQIVEVSQDYFGPAADRFIDRQITMHLRKDPANLTSEDVAKLIDWLKLSFALLTKKTSLVEEYVLRLQLVADGRAKEALGRQWPQS